MVGHHLNKGWSVAQAEIILPPGEVEYYGFGRGAIRHRSERVVGRRRTKVQDQDGHGLTISIGDIPKERSVEGATH